MNRKKIMKAWLITWEWSGEAAAVADKVIGILNSRWPTERVSRIIEFLYNHCTSTVNEMAIYARSPNKNPYRAKRDFNSQITCGHHPWLWARLVDNLEVTVNTQTNIETISWNELPIYELTDEGQKELRGNLPQQYVRKLTGRVSNELIWDRSKGTYKDWWVQLNRK
jgi:hypothetical protein